MASERGQAVDFPMGFIASSTQFRAQYLDVWDEIVHNFVVKPQKDTYRSETSPYIRGGTQYRNLKKRVLLKDGETHKVVMTYVAILMTQLFAHPRNEYVSAIPVGWEDAGEKGPTVTKLLRYCFSLPGHFRTFCEGLTDAVLFGTSVIESPWKYDEREQIVRTVIRDAMGERSTEDRLMIPVYDDPKLTNIDVTDFFPDPSRYRIQDMCGCAKRFRVNAYEARKMAAAGLYDSAAVEMAIGKGPSAGTKDESFRTNVDQPSDTTAISGFKEMVAYEYWGEVPPDAGIRDLDTSEVFNRGVITILNGIDVRRKAWPLADPYAPFHTLIINPLQGRFYGISPAEVIRYDQSFADAIKMLLAEAIVRQVHPPIAFDSDSDFDRAALRDWKADTLVGVRGGPSSIGTLRYDANVQNGFGMLTGLKTAMQEDSGALGAIQGQNGPDRESATVGANRYNYAKNRPELASMIIEKECLPPIAQAIIRRYQQFLGGLEDLKMRVGELPEPAWIGDIMGDFDVQFIGSRLVNSRQEKLQAWDRLTGMSTAVPEARMMIPWMDVLRPFIGDVLDLPEVAAKIGDPQSMQLNMLLQQMTNPTGGANGVAQGSQPAGALPAQVSGGIQ